MVDKTAQLNRRQQLISLAKTSVIKDTASRVILFSISIGLLVSPFLHAVRWVYISSNSNPATAREMSYFENILIPAAIVAVFYLIKGFFEYFATIDLAKSMADELDAKDLADEAQAREEARRRVEAELAAKRQREEADRHHAAVMAEYARREAAEQRARRLAEVTQTVLNGWARYQIDRDFLGQVDDAELKRAYVSLVQKKLSGADWALLHESQDPRIRAIFSSVPRLR